MPQRPSVNASTRRTQPTPKAGRTGHLAPLVAGAPGVVVALALLALAAPPLLLAIEAWLAGRSLPSPGFWMVTLGWGATWMVLVVAAAAFSMRRGTPSREPTIPDDTAAQPTRRTGAESQLSAASVLELVNQQWVTPLGHIRSAVDSLATLERRLSRCAPPTEPGQQEPAKSLQLMRHASHRLRISIENIIDYHEINAGRMTRTDGRVNLRTTGEDLVTDWQTTAQRDGEVLQFIGYQDLPREIVFDPQMLRRLLDRLLNEILCIAQLHEPAITLELEDDFENDGGDRIGRFRLTVDGQLREGSLDREQLTERLVQPLPEGLEGLLVDDLIDLWILRCISHHLDSALEVVETTPDRFGMTATFSAPILIGEPDSSDRLAGQLIAVVCASPQHRRAWQGNLAALGASIQVEPDFGQPVDLLFIDERIVERHHGDPAFGQWVSLAGRVIGLSSHLTIRGRPAAPLHWADFTLPLFIRARALAASLERVLGAPAPGPGHRPARLAPPAQPQRPTASTAPSRPAKAGRHALYSFAGRTALVIDDDPVYLAHLGQTLRELGFHVLEATNGKQALALADHEDIDVVFTDMHMPDITGAGVARILKKRPRHLETPIIAITANRQGNVHQDLLHSGIERVLTKPVTAGDLLSAIGEFFPLETHGRVDPEASPPANGDRKDERDPFLTRLLCDELPGYRRLLTEQTEDRDALRHAAHKLRGAAACCRETELQTLAGELEDALDANADAKRIDPLLDSLIGCIDGINANPVCDSGAS
ncbi:response regulator [Guyparkeria halophila]|uniref:Response regulator n=1 Tax=Guyparkeria halophila TaxID=47960 RepID=A0A6I6D4J9_9GAMM|nr:response regulator [Guyparkeria halophila]